MVQIKTVLFDLGNVLAFIDFQEFWRTLGFVHPEEIAPFAGGYRSQTRRYETGLISTRAYLSGLESVFNNRFTAEQLEQAFASILREPVDGMAELATRVSHTHRTALVSNTNEIHYRRSIKDYEVLGVLHQHYLSYQLHVMKPDNRFYKQIIDGLNEHPSEMLFIDDIESNVEGARFAGMQAIRFEGVEKLNVSLKELLG
ncbi:MAG: HAD family phosphatase [Ignavibacteriae bacterium]|nr:MAG: HAD family phosphatase [Ignavibacteriota bacterium]